jgi:predicted permease
MSIRNLIRDLAIAARMILRRPRFAAIAVATLAVGIGAGTAVFSVVRALLLRSLPYRDAGRLAFVEGTGGGERLASFDEFRQWRTEGKSFEKLFAVSPLWGFVLTGDADPEQVKGQFVSPGFFASIGVAPAIGRGFVEEEHRTAAPVVVISDGLWRRRFGADPGIVGRRLAVDGAPATIVGVAPPGFEFLEPADVWSPLERNPFSRSRGYVRMLSVAGRLRPGASTIAAGGALASAAAILAGRPTDDPRIAVRVVPLRDHLLGRIRPAILTLFGAVGLVLLIASANVSSLVLARSAARRRELSIRAALGAGAWDRFRLIGAECLLLSGAGAAAGAALARAALPLLLSISPVPLPLYANVAIDGAVLAFSGGVALAVGLVLAVFATRSAPGPAAALHEGGNSTATRSVRSAGSALVAVETAVALVLLAGAGLLLRSLIQLTAVDPGFVPDHAMAFEVSLPGARYHDAAARTAFAREVESRIGALPGVVAIGRVTRLPMLSSGNNVTTFLSLEGRPLPPAERPEIDFRRASTGYFPAMRIPLLEGRLVTEAEIAAGTRNVVVNRTLAQRFFPGGKALGRRISTATATGEGDWQTIVGVVGDVRHLGLAVPPRPEVYYHVDTSPPSGPVFVVRSTGGLRALPGEIRAAVSSLDREVPVSNLASLDDLVADSAAPRRVALQILGGFALLAVLLAGVGVYGVISFSAAQRTREIGIRIAIGASPASIVGLIVADAGRPAAAGIALGLAGAAAATRLVSPLLFAVSPRDPLTFASVAAALGATALLAALLPARRAARLDPARSLRRE